MSADRENDVLRITAGDLDRAEPLGERPAAIQPARAAGRYCPMCGSVAASAARLCPSCGEAFVRKREDGHPDEYDPRQRMRDAEMVPLVRRAAITAFVGAILGVFAPLALVAGLILLIAYRRSLRMAGPVYTALACFAVVVSLIYSGMAVAALTFWSR